MKFVSLTLALLMCLALCLSACGEDGKSKNTVGEPKEPKEKFIDAMESRGNVYTSNTGLKFTYNKRDDTISYHYDSNDSSFGYTIDGAFGFNDTSFEGKLTMKYGQWVWLFNIYTFKKSDSTLSTSISMDSSVSREDRNAWNMVSNPGAISKFENIITLAFREFFTFLDEVCSG